MWRDTGRTVRFLGVDGRATFLLLLALYHVSYWTAGLCVVGIAVLALLEQKGYKLPVALRVCHVKIMGKRRPAVTSRRQGRSDR